MIVAEKSLRHDPVMAAELRAILPLKPGAVVADGTLGLGGHALEFARDIRPGGVYFATDRDLSMLSAAQSRLSSISDVTWHLHHNHFDELPAILDSEQARPDAILLDLGLNSAQIDDPERGLSFRETGPLDMRMDRSSGEPASALLNRLSPQAIEDALYSFGDERWSRAIAKTVVEKRKTKPLRTTQDLVDCVLESIPPGARDKRIHPATRTFQAIRILVNGEMTNLEATMTALANRLNAEGCLAILSYHSGEDRAAKRSIRDLPKSEFDDLFPKPRVPSEEEIRRNPRSRSAKLRVIRRRPAPTP
jgi:16S rRNA (cytosine1402-N4)-methyltransferase